MPREACNVASPPDRRRVSETNLLSQFKIEKIGKYYKGPGSGKMTNVKQALWFCRLQQNKALARKSTTSRQLFADSPKGRPTKAK